MTRLPSEAGTAGEMIVYAGSFISLVAAIAAGMHSKCMSRLSGCPSKYLHSCAHTFWVAVSHVHQQRGWMPLLRQMDQMAGNRARLGNSFCDMLNRV